MEGKKTLKRLEMRRQIKTRYHKIRQDEEMIEKMLVDLFVEEHRREPKQIVLDLEDTEEELKGQQEGRF